MTSPEIGSIARWQREFRAATPVYYTVTNDGEPTGNFYESREAAVLEVEFCARHKPKERIRIAKTQIHTLALSRDRWKP